VKGLFKIITAVFLTIMVSGVILPQHHQRDDDDRRTPAISERTAELLDRIKDNLNDLDADYLTQLHWKEYNKAKRDLHKIYDMIEVIKRQQDVDIDPPITAMPDPEYQQLVKSIDNESFEENKVSVLQSSARYNYFSVQQIIGIMDLSSFSSWKIKALELTYPFAIDKNNSFKIINALTFSEDKQKAQEILDGN